MERYDFYAAQIAKCTPRIMEEPAALELTRHDEDGVVRDEGSAKAGDPLGGAALRASLERVTGVDLTAIPTIGTETALAVESEIGPDFSAFPICQRFCSWLGLSPGTRTGGDRRLRSKGRAPAERVGQAPEVAAMPARRSQTFIGAKRRSRLESAKAIKATAHELARIVWAMLKAGQAYFERASRPSRSGAGNERSTVPSAWPRRWTSNSSCRRPMRPRNPRQHRSYMEVVVGVLASLL